MFYVCTGLIVVDIMPQKNNIIVQPSVTYVSNIDSNAENFICFPELYFIMERASDYESLSNSGTDILFETEELIGICWNQL